MEYLGFTLDPFQEQAVRAVDEGRSVIVSAPTGCGKTLIAEYAVDVSMYLGKKVVYTAPIKALSNQKFRDFRKRFGAHAVGIHTGDVTLNPDAPLLIMTTEIFRNLILEESGRLEGIHYAVFDEIHYLDDPERGTVWEESIILAPQSIRFLCLSATVPNIRELAEWMGVVRGTEFVIVKEHVRPVPLRHHLFSAKYGPITLKGVKKKYKKRLAERKKFVRRKPSSKKIVHYVLSNEQYPILYFCFNRRACEANAERHADLNLLNDEEQDRVREMVDELVAQYRLDDYVRLGRMRRLWESGCAYHHAGILPAAKEIVERLFTEGLIKILFCTETFALGINMPASSVIFDELEKFNGVEFTYLSTRHYRQMAGRAGRRGMDDVGHVYSQVVPEAADPKEIERILHGHDEKIASRFLASYSTILTLYNRFGDEAYAIFRKSLRNYRKGEFTLTRSYRREEAQIRNRIAFLQAAGFLEGRELTPKGGLAAAVSGYEIQAAELYFTQSFSESSPRQLAVILAALVTEESRRRPRVAASDIRLSFSGEKAINRLRRLEVRHGVAQPIREMDFSLAGPIMSWASGCTLKELESYGIPEGDLVRVLRMTVQLLRTLRDRLDDPVVSERMHEALLLVNRDVVDAQAELQVG
ncbi:MAG: DEAD/DEAH box helicase [Chitinivibrionales bacterium]|nr:DEAD/DEAH box helicase [Chitinivibrionales bacterium]MBD3358599.1 DEAD/DEAH box helicase [Chitinivibrionales bacterium]